MKYTFLSGGTGTPKLLQGFRELVADKDLGIICNSGDDYLWNGMYVCPDLDTVLYQFSHKLDLKKFWGVKNETFESLEVLKSLKADNTWFNVGDKDLALHVYRTNELKTKSLTHITQQICNNWDIEATIIPMSDYPVQSRIYSAENSYHFQEYFVKLRTNIPVSNVEFVGNKKSTTDEVRNLIEASDSIIIGPSNPITSIGPILAIDEIRKLLKKHRQKVIIVSPIKSGSAFSGPTIELMKSMNVEPSPIGLAKYYRSYAGKIIFDPEDQSLEEEINSMGIETIFHPIELSTQEQKKKLATTILDLI
ncbi:MAG: 2-phospho-L-lactate transferase [Candidatus Heimdallarchaeota archaeon]|nr:2-phospho-L-lactate transferase [Candidatus Heimdallarchaeota archaeon]